VLELDDIATQVAPSLEPPLSQMQDRTSKACIKLMEPPLSQMQKLTNIDGMKMLSMVAEALEMHVKRVMDRL
jgi:hypothetical protein